MCRCGEVEPESSIASLHFGGDFVSKCTIFCLDQTTQPAGRQNVAFVRSTSFDIRRLWNFAAHVYQELGHSVSCVCALCAHYYILNAFCVCLCVSTGLHSMHAPFFVVVVVVCVVFWWSLWPVCVHLKVGNLERVRSAPKFCKIFISSLAIFFRSP